MLSTWNQPLTISCDSRIRRMVSDASDVSESDGIRRIRNSDAYCRHMRKRTCSGDVDCVRPRIRTCVNRGWVSADFCGMQDTSLLLYSGYAYLLPSCLRIRLRIQAVSMRHSGGLRAHEAIMRCKPCAGQHVNHACVHA